jgi:hypothetical protein
MVKKKTLFLSVVIAVVLAIPTVAWALNGPLGADLEAQNTQRPVAQADDAAGESYGWMNQMHNYMWSNGALPDDLPADTANWMNQMHNYMWSNGEVPVPGRGEPGSDSGTSFRPVPRNGSVAPAGRAPGAGWGGCGMWGGR